MNKVKAAQVAREVSPPYEGPDQLSNLDYYVCTEVFLVMSVRAWEARKRGWKERDDVRESYKLCHMVFLKCDS